MKLTLNGVAYEVDMSPLHERAATGIEQLVGDRDKSPVLRQMVKAACQYAMGHLGIEKKDRNDDPIALVALHVTDLIFKGIEAGGITLEGDRIEQLESGESIGD